MTINERIIEIISSQKNLSQKNLAEHIGIAASTVNNWLKLGRSIPAEYIIPISEYLGIDAYYLLTGEKNTENILPISQSDKDWIALIHQLPADAQIEFRGELKGYLKRINEESVASGESLRQVK